VINTLYTIFCKTPNWLLKLFVFKKPSLINGQVLDLKSSIIINFITKQLPMLSEDTNIDSARIQREAIKLQLSNKPICTVNFKDEFLATSESEVLLREYVPDNLEYQKCMLFFHGGGHVFGGKETHHDFLMYFASLLKIKVYALDYRLAPEFPFPADIEDAEIALNYLHTEKSIPVEDLVLCGDSAGAGVSAGLTASLILNNKPYPSLQCLIYPMLDPSCSSKTMQDYAEGYYLTEKSMKFFWDKYSSKREDHQDPRFNLMLSAKALDSYPKTHIVTAGFDPLCGEAEDFALGLYNKGFDITQSHYPNMFHAFINFNKIPACDIALKDLAASIRGWYE
jgi:acetyl esterase